MMKKVVTYIVLSVLLVMGAASCVEPLPEWQEPVPEIADDALVTLTFGAPAEVSTKALGEKPQNLESMHVFLFNKDGMLLVAKPARFVSVTDNGRENKSHWSVDLPMGTAERRIHFVANLGTNYTPPTTGSEMAIMRPLTTSGGRDAYWQCKKLPNGISAYQYDGSGRYSYRDPASGEKTTVNVEAVTGYQSKAADNSWYIYEYEDAEGFTHQITVNEGDYITVRGWKVLDGTALYASEPTSDAVEWVPMVRNFAEIRVMSNTGSNFQISEAVLINTPKAGFVVPFDDRESQNKILQKYLDAEEVQEAGVWKANFDYADILATGYPATIPGAGIETFAPDGPPANTVVQKDADGVVKLFMYERGIPTADATAVLVHGRNTTSNKDLWYKIELLDADGNFFPVYRDIIYDIKINSINSTDEHTTMLDAFNSAPVGDISSSPETKTLTHIDDGKGLELWVEYIDYTSMESTSSDVRLLYKFTYTKNGTTTNLNNKVTLELNGYGSSIQPAVTAVTTASENYSGTDTPDSQTGWRLATVTVAGVGQNMKHSYIHVSGTMTPSDVTNGYLRTLYRNVDYRVLPKQDFELATKGLVSDGVRQRTTLTIKLPPNVLGYSVFPMTLLIEAENNCLTPVTENIPVETGTSAFDSSHNTFYFLMTINYSDYQANIDNPVFTCTFETTKTSGNATQIRVSDRMGLFNPGTVALQVGTDSTYPTP